MRIDLGGARPTTDHAGRGHRRVTSWAASISVAALVTTAMIAPQAGAATPLSASAPVAAPGDHTSAVEARRVDQVATPRFSWFDCSTAYGTSAQCTTTRLPLNYDQPTGASTEVDLLRVPATDQRHKIGSLFVNPGGPGGSGVDMAAAAGFFLSPDLLARFDIVGFDPRGTNLSDNVRCWPNLGAQAAALSGMNVAFPYTATEKSAFIGSAKAMGRACSTTGRPLSASMSTAEVARDMDVLRRGLGDPRLNYLGFSYGTYLGQVYANLFPDRVRSMVIDGVLDPIAWAGTAASNTEPQTTRLRSGEGGAKALRELLVRCGRAGTRYCRFASFGVPLHTYAVLIAALKKSPILVHDPSGDFTISYADVISRLLGAMYAPAGYADVDDTLTSVATFLHTPPTASQHAAAGATLRRLMRQSSASATPKAAPRPFGFPYFNGPDAFVSVLCTDGLNPANAAAWPAYADAADRAAPDFGRLWTWSSAACASNTWTVRDPNAYRGPFTRYTAGTVLVVGDLYDPATNYRGAVTAASLLPNSRLLSSNSWGHTAYGTSDCVTGAVSRYLISTALPARGTVCQGDVQPFSTPLGAAAAAQKLVGSGRRAPVVPPVRPRG